MKISDFFLETTVQWCLLNHNQMTQLAKKRKYYLYYGLALTDQPHL